MSILNNQLLYYQMCINLAVFRLLQKFLVQQYQRSSNILAKFINDDETTNIYPGQVQFYFEHTIQLSTGTTTHRLAFVKWYLYALNQQTQFFCRISNEMTKVTISNYGRMIFMIYREMLLCRFIIYTVDFYLANLQ